MNLPKRLLSLCLVAATGMLVSCASTTRRVVANDSFMLSIVDDTVSVSCKSPMQVAEFLKMAQLVTNRMYTFHKDDAVREVSWVGSLSCDRSEFGEFVETMLQAKGLAVHVRQQGEMEILEVSPIKAD